MIKHSGKVVKIATGTYTGDGTQNRAIPHGLGVKPAIVFVVVENGASTRLFTNSVDDELVAISSANVTVTAKTSSNFYVGDAPSTNDGANAAATEYRWFAIG